MKYLSGTLHETEPTEGVMDREIERYLPAAGIQSIPEELGRPEPTNRTPQEVSERYAFTTAATKIWCAADTESGRRQALEAYRATPDAQPAVVQRVLAFLQGAGARRPTHEIEDAMASLGLAHPDNELLSAEERASLDRDGYLNLGVLLSQERLMQMRARYDEAVVAEGADAQHTKGIARIADTVIMPMNRDGLLDEIFMHPRLLAAVRHILGVHIKFCGSNYHCPLPGYGHQPIHADFVWGVVTPMVVNAVWMIDAFTEENGATRVVPGSHAWGVHPAGHAVDGKPLDCEAEFPGQRLVTGDAGSCIVYNAHLWHGGTQNRSNRLRRAQHAFFTRANFIQSADVPVAIDSAVQARLSPEQRALLDIA